MAKISELADGGAVLSDDEILVLRAGGNVRATIGSGLTSNPSGEVDMDGKKFTDFESTGIDDNATSTAITIDSNENVGIGATGSFPYHGWATAVTLNGATNSAYEIGQAGTKAAAFAVQGDGRTQLIN